jgi:ABC-type uncharacterized transport system ATPase subunit
MTQPSGPPPESVVLRSVTVTYGSLVANRAVSLTCRRGEVHAILGENGAGKSTLVKVLAGLVRPDSGEVIVNGVPMRANSAIEASRHGIGVVHQHFMLIPTMTVAQNVGLGLPRGLVPDLARIGGELTELGARYHLDVDPDALVGNLSVGQRQRVEIVKALYRGAEILVLDEPTAVLSPAEVEGLFETVRELTRQGTTVLFISHKLREITEISQQVTVLRQGEVVASVPTAGTTEAELARLMVGRLVEPERAGPAPTPGPEVLRVSDLRVLVDGRAAVDGASFAVAGGEILGIAAIEGNGQHELIEAVVGLRAASGGSIVLNRRDLTGSSIRERITAGVAHIPEDRIETALAAGMSVQDNLMSVEHAEARFARRGVLRRRAVRAHTAQLITDFDIRCRSAGQPVGQLSGGNQQKVVVAREVSRRPALLLAVHPSRGLDVGAAGYVHRQLLGLRAAGGAVVLLSSELEELLALSDRIAVMSRGRLTEPQPRAEVDVDRLGLQMAGRA